MYYLSIVLQGNSNDTDLPLISKYGTGLILGCVIGPRGHEYLTSLRSMFKSLARIAIPLFKRGAKAVSKRALKAATEVGQHVLEGKNVLKSLKSRGSDAVKEIA